LVPSGRPQSSQRRQERYSIRERSGRVIARRQRLAVTSLAERLMAWHHRFWTRSFIRRPALATRVVVYSLPALPLNIRDDRRKNLAGRPIDHVAANAGDRE
jgi:hypothetical protein